MPTKLPTVAIIGRANAGKSSLFNRLVRSHQAIVAREAGTTRDNVVGKVSYSSKQQVVRSECLSRQTAQSIALSSPSMQPSPSEGSALPAEPTQDEADSEVGVPEEGDGRSGGVSRKTGAMSTRTQSRSVLSDSGDSAFPAEASQDRLADGGERAPEADSNETARERGDWIPERVRDDAQRQTGEFWLVDTAGLKTAEDEFEAGIQEQIDDAAEAADVILVVVDSTEYPGNEERLVAKKALRSKKPVILIVNKTDLAGSLPNEEFRRLGISDMIRCSAEHAVGIHEIIDTVAALIPPAVEREPDDTLRIALIGRPNVGKSSLFNTLAGKQQAIVANVAGTTRDLNRIKVNYHKQPVELIDTAGVRRPGKQERGIEKFSVLRTMQAIEEANICLLLMDVGEHSTALDQKLAGIIDEAGKGMIIVVTKWDSVDDKDTDTHDQIARRISNTFDFTPWAPLIFTSSITGQNVTKLLELAFQIRDRRLQEPKTRELNNLLNAATQKHPPAGLKNTHPKLRYMVHTDTTPPWFVVYGSNLKFLHWSYKRYLERLIREKFDYIGTPIKFSFRDEKQIKANKERIAKGLEPVTKAYKQAKNSEL